MSPFAAPNDWPADMDPSVGNMGDSFDNALAETISSIYKAKLIHRRVPGKIVEPLQLATLAWVNWFNHQWL
jgi:putative transposase